MPTPVPAGTCAKPTDVDLIIEEAWSTGFCIGAILIMVAFTVSNLRPRVILHKLILLEVWPQ